MAKYHTTHHARTHRPEGTAQVGIAHAKKAMWASSRELAWVQVAALAAQVVMAMIIDQPVMVTM